MTDREFWQQLNGMVRNRYPWEIEGIEYEDWLIQDRRRRRDEGMAEAIAAHRAGVPGYPATEEHRKLLDTQRRRKADRRNAVRAMFGGVCQECQHDGSTRPLHFHHKDGSVRGGRKREGHSHSEARRHPERFLLLCLDCHMAKHRGRL